jgi:uncharacterized protein YabN with tetrapyrrole methylase and pyrophosphatase domain
MDENPSLLETLDAPENGALRRAQHIGVRVADVGFDWPDAASALDKVREEVAELAELLEERAPPRERLRDELGDLLFATAMVARKLELDAEDALRCANAKFVRRWRHIERALAARGSSPDVATLEEMERLWTDAKRGELDRGTE